MLNRFKKYIAAFLILVLITGCGNAAPQTDHGDGAYDVKQAEVTFLEPESDDYADYYVPKYGFKDGLTTGEFTLETVNSYSKEYVTSLKVGDELEDGTQIESVELADDESYAWINKTSGDSIKLFKLQKGGDYYLFDDTGVASTTSAGIKTFPIADDVKIIDDVCPYDKEGIRLEEGKYRTFDSVKSFIAKLDDDDVWFRPDLFIRVENGEVTLIIINPWQVSVWRD